MSRLSSIAMICYPTIGGSSRVATELASRLAQRGIDVHLISYERPWRITPQLHFHRVHVREYPLLRFPPYDQALAVKIAELYETYGVEVFHAHYAIPHAVAVALADQMLGGGKLRLVTTLHGTDITLVGNDPAYGRAVAFGLERSDCVTAVSESLSRDTKRILGFEGEIRVIPNSVDPEAFRPGTAARWTERGDDEPRRLVHISTFRPIKQILVLCEAVALLRRHVPVRLTLVGDGPELETAIEWCRANGFVGDLDLVGATEDPAPYLADADLYLFSSRTESFGLGLLEAMASSVPVVGPDVGGVAEVLGAEPAGCLVGAGSAAELAAAARELLTDRERYQRACARARERAVSVFSPDRMVEGYLGAYEAALR